MPSLSLVTKNNKNLSLEETDNDLTWDEATMTWDEATATWQSPGRPITKAGKNSKSLTLGNITLNLSTNATAPGTIVNTDGGGGTGTDPWSNVSNVGDSDDSYAQCSMGSDDYSDYLDATNFGFAIPNGTTIVGVLVEIEKKASVATGCVDELIKLIKGGTAQGNNKQLGTAWPNTDTYISYGGSSDLWGLTLTPDDINASNFGIRIQAANTAGVGSRTAYIDHIRITIYY